MMATSPSSSGMSGLATAVWSTRAPLSTFDQGDRALDDGDVAIMMVRGRVHPQTLKLIADRTAARSRPTEETVAEGLEAAKPFYPGALRGQQQPGRPSAKPTAEYPGFLDYGEDVYEAVAGEFPPSWPRP